MFGSGRRGQEEHRGGLPALHAWTMSAVFGLLALAGMAGVVRSSWEWDFFHLVVAAAFAYAVAGDGGDGFLCRSFVYGTGGVLILLGPAFGVVALLWGDPVLAAIIGYPALGTVSLLAARFL